MELQDWILQLKKEANELNLKIDFKERDLIRMTPEVRQEKMGIIRSRNEALEKIKILDFYQRKKQELIPERYVKFKYMNNEQLLNELVKNKFDANFAGGREFRRLNDLYEEQRDELYWRLQFAVDVVNNKRICSGFNMEDLEIKESPVMLEEAYQLLISTFDQSEVDKNVEGSKLYYILFCDEVIACALFNDEEVSFLTVKSDFRCCGLGTKILNKLRTRYAQSSNNLKIYGDPEKAYHFILKNDWLIETNIHNDIGMYLYKTEDFEENDVVDLRR